MEETIRSATRRIVSLMAALIVALGIVGANAVPVMAANDGSITVKNSEPGTNNYSIYKIFDATYSESGGKTNVAYTYTKTESSDAFYTALTGDSSPFKLTQQSSSDVYTVEKKNDSVTDQSIINFIKSQGPTYNSATKVWSGGNFGNAVSTKSGTGSDLVFDNLAYGYYFITSNTGATVTINSAAKAATVIDKNERIPLPEKQESIDNGSTWHDDVKANIGDTIYYKVTGKIARYFGTEGTTPVSNMIFTDTVSNGLTRNDDVVVKIKSPNQTEATLTAGTDYTLTKSTDGKTYTITLTTATGEGSSIDFKYETGTEYTITYSAVLNQNAFMGNPSATDEGNKNTVSLKYDNSEDVGSDTTTVETYGIGITKVDSSDSSKALPGAKFKLYKDQDCTQEIEVDLTETESPSGMTIYKPHVSTNTAATMEVGENGAMAIRGLKPGKYYLKETVAPEGYNLPSTPFTLTVPEDNTTLNITNTAGSMLPSTGGIGTTIFYVIGGILVAGAVVLLIVRKKRA